MAFASVDEILGILNERYITFDLLPVGTLILSRDEGESSGLVISKSNTVTRIMFKNGPKIWIATVTHPTHDGNRISMNRIVFREVQSVPHNDYVDSADVTDSDIILSTRNEVNNEMV